MAQDTKTVGAEQEWEIGTVHGEPRAWQSQKGGDMLSYRIDVRPKGKDEPVFRRVELAQKKDTAAPQSGGTLDGEVTERTYGENNEKTDLKFKKAARGGGGGGGGRYKPRPDDSPKVYAARQAQIARQHSQDVAFRIVELAHAVSKPVGEVAAEVGIVLAPDGSEEPLSLVEAVHADVTRAGASAWSREADNGMIAAAVKEV